MQSKQNVPEVGRPGASKEGQEEAGAGQRVDEQANGFFGRAVASVVAVPPAALLIRIGRRLKSVLRGVSKGNSQEWIIDAGSPSGRSWAGRRKSWRPPARTLGAGRRAIPAGRCSRSRSPRPRSDSRYSTAFSSPADAFASAAWPRSSPRRPLRAAAARKRTWTSIGRRSRPGRSFCRRGKNWHACKALRSSRDEKKERDERGSDRLRPPRWPQRRPSPAQRSPRCARTGGR